MDAKVTNNRRKGKSPHPDEHPAKAQGEGPAADAAETGGFHQGAEVFRRGEMMD
jgi:hypothetical protein